MAKPTAAQRRVLELARDGKPLDSGLIGMSAYGGLQRTVWSCRRWGWLNGEEITGAGRAALEAK